MTVCVITDSMGNDATHETAILESAGLDVFVAPSPDPGTWLVQAARR